MRLLHLLSLSIVAATSYGVALHLVAYGLSPEFVRDYLVPFAEAPDFLGGHPVAVAAYRGAAHGLRPGAVGGVALYVFSTLGGRPRLSLRQCAGVVLGCLALVATWGLWVWGSATGAGASPVAVAGDVLASPARAGVVALAIGSVVAYAWRLRMPTPG